MEYTKLLGKVTLTTDGLHDSARTYDRLCLVYDSAYRSFISIKDVPANISIDNKTYWQPLSIITADNEDLMQMRIYVLNLQIKSITLHRIAVWVMLYYAREKAI